ncbi:MAG TPA: ATP-binding protein [Xanthobacteraceae bacterium]|nr:ATP-binding protein [Xanthobacteraceae bacterium]
MQFHIFRKRWGRLAGRPQSIRHHLAGVFLVFFLLVCVLGSFSIWRLSNFNRLSADVAEVWLPTTRVLGDLNNFTSDFRAIEGSNLLSTDQSEIAATETDMAALDRSIAQAQRGFEKIAHDPAENDLYDRFKADWTDYRKIVNQMLVLSRGNRKAEALSIYGGTSRVAYNAASDTLGQLTDQAVASAQIASDRLAVAYRQAFWLILLAVAIAGVMVVAALFHISRSISGPLLQLADRMRRLAANDTDIDVPETGRADEIGEMAQATVVFRNNAIALMESQRMLARQAALLAEQLAQEQRLALQQRNFVSMASHEFRTPMTIIDGHARRLIKLKDSIGPAEIGERAGKMRSAVLRMTQLIDNLLNSSRLIDGGGGQYFHPAEMDMATLLQEVCDLHREMVPGARIAERIATAPMRVVGDPKLLFQVFSNLLSNAIKYSPDGGVIAVDAALASDEVIVTIADRGIGVPAGDLDRLFERYHRGSNVSGIVGTGVGLYLVKMVVDMHGGAVAVESTEGEGARFTIRLPRKPAAAVETTAIAEAPSIADPPDALQSVPSRVSE